MPDPAPDPGPDATLDARPAAGPDDGPDGGPDDGSRLPAAAALRGLLDRRSGTLAVPGGGTPLEALCAAEAGFAAFYVSGYAVAAWRHGVPDIGLTGLSDLVAAVSAIRTACRLPLVVDADTGYGDAPNVALCVQRLEEVGVAAIQIEDQQWPKRCGHLDGKRVVDAADMERKVAAAVRSRTRADTLVIARTDARGPLGLAEALDRGRRYADAGADLVFVDAPQSEAELAEIAATIPVPTVVNMSESGLTPILPLADLSRLGFAVAIYPTAALRVAAELTRRLFRELRDRGTTDGWLDRMMTMDDLNDLVGLARFRQFELDQV
jgi:2-methylisocitrate lyase-like PEP mutase family enzyme